jgi:hypothetical protein
MAADLKEALENFKAQAGTFRSFFELADRLDGIADVERAAQEAETTMQAKRNEVDALERQRIAAVADAEQLAVSSKEEAEKIVADAKAEAAQIIAGAAIGAKIDADKIIEAANEQQAAAKAFADAAAKRAKAANAKADAADAELAELEAKIASAKEQIAKLLGS